MDQANCPMASLLPKLGELLIDKFKLQITSIRKDLEFLFWEIEVMQEALRKVQEVPQEQLDVQVKIWAREVRMLSYKMEVFFEKFQMNSPNLEGSKGIMNNICNLFKKGKTHHQIIAAAIKDFKVEIQQIADRRGRYAAPDRVDCTTITAVDPRLLTLYRGVQDFVGIDSGKYQDLVKLLLVGENTCSEKLKMVSVVGFGGLGKTTLVRLVYENINMRFGCKAFVSAGQNADVKKVVQAIIYDLNMHYTELNTLNERQLIENLRQLLENKRYLIVIDDIWDKNLWEHIKYAFSSDNNLGSRIITTTRISSVSKALCSSTNDSIYHMEPLSDDDSKKLLYGRIVGYASEHTHEFEQASRDILKKCRGVPLAIITASSILTMKPQEEWYVLLKSICCGLIIENKCWENMRRILAFSYYDLPPHLKTCLLYLSTFPENATIERDRLLKKWIVEGIVTQKTKLTGTSNKKQAILGQELSMEEAASQCLDELVNRNVIQTLECNNDCEVITYHIHPMMHGVIKAIATEEMFAVSLDDKDISSARHMNIPHISVDYPDRGNLVDSSTMAFDGDVRSLTVSGHANRFLLRACTLVWTAGVDSRYPRHL